MIISKDDVQKVANLARIELNQEELNLFSGQLESVLEFIEKLKKADVSSIQPMSHILDIQWFDCAHHGNVLRADVLRESLPNALALKNAPESLKGHFRVPKVIE
ncbi:MAG: Asp-tRNA(Asn)/Glu-tRNA(Gln) amidotransferase subunit GatC [Candidatus Omnitrophota bacterium]